jgi:hypothetical protein
MKRLSWLVMLAASGCAIHRTRVFEPVLPVPSFERWHIGVDLLAFRGSSGADPESHVFHLEVTASTHEAPSFAAQPSAFGAPKVVGMKLLRTDGGARAELALPPVEQRYRHPSLISWGTVTMFPIPFAVKRVACLFELHFPGTKTTVVRRYEVMLERYEDSSWGVASGY